LGSLRTRTRRTCGAGVIGFTLNSGYTKGHAMSANSVHLAYVPESEVALYSGTRALWRYHFATDSRKSYLHPIMSPNGVELTGFEPQDQSWQRGLWFAWQYVNGANYSEEGLPELGPEGAVEFIEPEAIEAGPHEIMIRSHYHYHPKAGSVVMHDARIVSIATPSNGNSYAIDWDLAFTPTVDVTIEPLREGGSSGLAWRAARGLGDFTLHNSNGEHGDDARYKRAAWVDLSGKVVDDSARSAGMAFMVHPSTPRTPAHWNIVTEPGAGLLNPSPVLDEELCLAAGEVLRLRYRILVHDGTLTPEGVEEEYQQYCRL
jgi:hypothetical protein